MLNLDRVFHLFCLFADLDEAEAADWRWLCEAAEQTVTRRLREGVEPSAEMERLCAAAASIANDRYNLLRPGGFSEQEEIKVGDITVKNGSGAGEKESLQEHFLAEISDLLRFEGGFMFQQTPSGESA